MNAVYIISDMRAGPLQHGPVWTTIGQDRNVYVDNIPVTSERK